MADGDNLNVMIFWSQLESPDRENGIVRLMINSPDSPL